jgi:hypothetical protein
MTSRERLAGAQADLLRALLASGEIPAGFAEDRVCAEVIVLRNKRRRVTVHIRPDLRQALGDRFAELFDAYAAGHPRTEGTRAREDADAFGDWLIERGELSAPRKRWRLPGWRIASR